jgi:hypothetical protein
MDAEMYDPRNDRWRTLSVQEPMTRVRNYHSTAILMPNGAVWHSGSNRDCMQGTAGRDRTVEIYEPWYFCGPRPIVMGVTSRACAGDRINIETPNAFMIDEVVLVRCSSFTHAFNPDQRVVSVPFERSKTNSNLLVSTLPNNSAVLIPGYYLLFILTRGERVPSIGRFIHVCRGSGLPGPAIGPDWLPRGLALLERLMIGLRSLEPFGRDGEDKDRIGFMRRLEELEAAVRRLEVKLGNGPGDGGKPEPPHGGGHGEHGGGHEH